MTGMFNPMEMLIDFESKATSGDEFAELYGWKDRDSLRDNERQFYNELWRVAFAHGRSQGQVDGVAYKSERTTALAKENTDLQNKLSEADALAATQCSQIESAHRKVAELESVIVDGQAANEKGITRRQELEAELRDAAVGLRRQRETIGELEKKVITLVNRNTKRFSYRAWHKIMTVADEQMSKAHP
jgi:hypothetical protein